MTAIESKTIRAGEYPQNVRVRSHSFTSDASVTAGGEDSAPGPHDLFDSALATCKAITATWYAKRPCMRQRLARCAGACQCSAD